MSTAATGDPASVSALGAALSRAGQGLADRRMHLGGLPATLRWRGPAATAFAGRWEEDQSLVDRIERLVLECAEAVQDHATRLQHLRGDGLALQRFCEDHGLLLLPGGGVQLPWGVHDADESTDQQIHLFTAQRMSDQLDQDALLAERQVVARLADLTAGLDRAAAELASSAAGPI